jgi:30S ribosome assembly GTPase
MLVVSFEDFLLVFLFMFCARLRRPVLSHRAILCRFSTARPLDTCFGCGEQFHSNKDKLAGYLPDMENRKQAFLMGISFDEYKKRVLENHLSTEYAKKRADMEHIISAANKQEIAESCDRLEGNVSNRTAISLNPEYQEPKQILCSRCHRLTHHRSMNANTCLDVETETQRMAQERAGDIVNSISTVNSFVIALCDVFDFPSSLCVDELRRISEKRPVIVAVNKCDLLPPGSNLDRIAYQLKSTLTNDLGMRNLVDVNLISLREDTGLDSLLAGVIRRRSPIDDIYILGKVNVGKSTLLKYLVDKFDGPKEMHPTSSQVPGTTLNQISVPLKQLPKLREAVARAKSKGSNKSSELSKLLMGNVIDTPGIENSNTLMKHLRPKEYSYVIPSKPIKPVSYFLEPGKCLWMGGLGRIDFVEGRVQIVATVFANSKLPIHISLVEKSQEVWEKHGGAKSIKWAEKLELDGVDKKTRAVRKNLNKDWWSGAKLYPPFFSDPQKYADSINHQSDEEPSGVLTERISSYPPFELALETTLTREKPLSPFAHSKDQFQHSLCDIVFAGVGWVSITGNFDQSQGRNALMRIWTPNGECVHLRSPSLLPFDVMKRGKKIRGAMSASYRPADEASIELAKKADQSWWDRAKKKMMA